MFERRRSRWVPLFHDPRAVRFAEGQGQAEIAVSRRSMAHGPPQSDDGQPDRSDCPSRYQFELGQWNQSSPPVYPSSIGMTGSPFMLVWMTLN